MGQCYEIGDGSNKNTQECREADTAKVIHARIPERAQPTFYVMIATTELLQNRGVETLHMVPFVHLSVFGGRGCWRAAEDRG